MEHFGIEARNERKKEGGSKQEEQGLRNYIRILGRYQFACVFSFLDLVRMVLNVVIFCLGMDFSRRDSVFSLALPFPDNNGVVEFSCVGLAGFPGGFKFEWGGSPN